MRKFAVICALLFAPLALSQELPSCPPTGTIAKNAALLCWTNATQDTDGNALPATGDGSLTQTRVQRAFVLSPTGACAWNTTTNEVQNFDVTPDVTRMFFENMKPGKWCFRLRHSALNVPDSVWTSPVSKVVPKPAAASGAPTVTVY